MEIPGLTGVTFYAVLALSAFLIALLGTRLMILARRKDIALIREAVLKGERNLRAPDGGGLAIVFALIMCLAVADLHYAVILSLLMLTALYLLGQMISVPGFVRLLVQAAAIAIALQVTPPTLGQTFPLWFDRVLTGLVWLWFVRLFASMDTIDSLAVAEMICVAGGLSLMAVFADTFPDPISTYGLITAAAGCGFLWWNWHPARIRLGAVGAVPIGFLLGYMLLLAAQAGYGWGVLILPAYYLADHVITLIRQIYKEKSLHEIHSDYYHQLALKSGRAPNRVVYYIVGINILLVFLAMRSVIDHELTQFHLAMAYLAVFMLMGFFAHTGNPKQERP